jgi:hypothetical protein
METEILENFKRAFENLKPVIQTQANVLNIKTGKQKIKLSLTPKRVDSIGFTR